MENYIPRGCLFINVDRNKDGRGNLTVLTNQLPTSFVIRRIYYVSHLKRYRPRGSHAHRLQSQALFVIRGRISITLDSGSMNTTFVLDENTDGIFISPLVWVTIRPLDKDAAYLVMADGPYDQGEYIYNYEEFKEIKKGVVT